MKMVLSAIVIWLLPAAVGCNTRGADAPASGPALAEQSPPTVASGRTVPATEVADVVHSLISLTGTEAKVDLIAKKMVKEFNERHAGDRLVLKFGINGIQQDGSAYRLGLWHRKFPEAFFCYESPFPSRNNKTGRVEHLCFLTSYKMPLTEQEILTIEEPKPGKDPTSFVELSGMCRLFYGPQASNSDKCLVIGIWNVPEHTRTDKQLSLLLDNPTPKLITPPH
jgi:hypothetical protein